MNSGVAFMVVGLLAMVLAFGMIGYVLRRTKTALPGVADAQLASAEREAEAIRGQAMAEAEEEIGAVKAIRDEIRELRADLERREARLAIREQRLDDELRRHADLVTVLDRRDQALDNRDRELSERDHALGQRDRELEKRHYDLERRLADLDREAADLRAGLAAELAAQRASQDRQYQDELARVAGLTAEQAKAELIKTIENQAKRAAARAVRDIEGEARKQGEARARRIVTTAIQRVAAEQVSESVVSVLHLPADEMKGRIIGREGRNIRAFESVTGVNVIIDDTPEAVLLSCFDPVRRETARLTLELLIADGRIHPQRIEEAYERGKAEIERLCKRAGEDAMTELGITDMHPELIDLLGRLRYRTSYGQNVLAHLIESAHIAAMMASELRLDPLLLKRAAVLHDVGKALTHEAEGPHALIGAEVARKYGESDDVVHAIEAHHNEVEPRTLEAVLTQAADAISGGRPGARRESLEMYVRRLQRLEEIAARREGVAKVFAMQAGREIRVMVAPDKVDDIQAQVIARDIAKQVEDELTFPGQIRVTVVRESRATEFAR